QLASPPPGYTDVRAGTVPLMGRIAAGVPISAIQNHTTDINVPPEMVSGGEHFALEVKGDSMIDAGINEGDIIICKRCDTADNGDIVVALVEKEEATLKRLRKKGASIALEAANPNYETRIFGPDQVDIQGRLVGLIRRFWCRRPARRRPISSNTHYAEFPIMLRRSGVARDGRADQPGM